MSYIRSLALADTRRNRSRRPFRPGSESLDSRRLLSASSADVLTYHIDNAGTGQDLDETTLTPSTPNESDLGARFTDAVDGAIYA